MSIPFPAQARQWWLCVAVGWLGWFHQSLAHSVPLLSTDDGRHDPQLRPHFLSLRHEVIWSVFISLQEGVSTALAVIMMASHEVLRAQCHCQWGSWSCSGPPPPHPQWLGFWKGSISQALAPSLSCLNIFLPKVILTKSPSFLVFCDFKYFQEASIPFLVLWHPEPGRFWLAIWNQALVFWHFRLEIMSEKKNSHLSHFFYFKHISTHFPQTSNNILYLGVCIFFFKVFT